MWIIGQKVLKNQLMHTFSHVSFKFPTPWDKHVPFVAKMSPPPRKLKKDHLCLFFIQNAPIDVKLAGGRQGMGHGEGIFTALDRGTQWLNVSKHIRSVPNGFL